MKKKRLIKSQKASESTVKTLCSSYTPNGSVVCSFNLGTGNDADILF